MTLTAAEVLDKIVKNAETFTEAHTDLRFARTVGMEEWIRQGDIALVRISKDSSVGNPITERQLAPGTTQGSRHIVEGKVKLFAPATGDPLSGPVIDAPGRFTVTHPEHADISLPAGRYGVFYQRDLQKEERARIQD